MATCLPLKQEISRFEAGPASAKRYAGVAEWFKAAVCKTVALNARRGFESRPRLLEKLKSSVGPLCVRYRNYNGPKVAKAKQTTSVGRVSTARRKSGAGRQRGAISALAHRFLPDRPRPSRPTGRDALLKTVRGAGSNPAWGSLSLYPNLVEGARRERVDVSVRVRPGRSVSIYGERGEVVNAPDCGSGNRGFESRRSP